MDTTTSKVQTIRLLRNTALVSGAFALILAVLILINFMQVKRADPLNSQALKILTERLKSSPGDEQLRQEVRELDLLARKAFFTNQWQVRTGGYLLFFSLLVVVICLKSIELIDNKTPDLPGKPDHHFWNDRILNRRWVTYTGLFIITVSLVAAYLTHNELGRNFTELASGKSSVTDTVNAGQPAISGQIQSDTAVAGTNVAKPDSATGLVAMVTEGYPTTQEIRENFTTFRGIGGNGIDFHKNIPTSWDGKSEKNIRWKTEVPLPGFNSPILWHDQVFLSGASDTKREVFCFDANTGRIRWRTQVENVPGSPAQSPKVNSETGQAAPTMTTDGRRVYAIFANGDVVALDMEGRKVWAKNLGLPVNHYGHSSSLIMYHDLLIIQYDQRNTQSVMALSGKTGDQVWKTTRTVKISWASPILVYTGKRNELILVAEPAMAGYDPATGKELWRIDCIGGEVGPSAAYANGIAFSVNDYSKLAAIELGETPKQLWEDNEYLSDIPSPLATEKYLFLITSYGMAACYDARGGTKYWEHDFGTPTYASPMLVEGKIYQMDKNGVMRIFKPDQVYTSISEPQLGEGSVCTPAFADGRIYIRGNKHLFCIGN
jgi:outer membrane protein assembly factor BamB